MVVRVFSYLRYCFLKHKNCSIGLITNLMKKYYAGKRKVNGKP